MEAADVDTLEVRGAVRTTGRNPGRPRSTSSLDVELVLRRKSAVARPVDLASTLTAFGLKLRDAHRAIDQIVADEEVSLRLGGVDPATMIARLGELGVYARER